MTQPARPSPGASMNPVEMARLASFTVAAAHNPRTRRAMAQIAGIVDPNYVGKAFVDVRLQDRLDAFERKFNDRDLQAQINDALRSQQAEKKSVVTERGYSDDQIADIERLMTAKNMYSYKDAAVLYDAEHPRIQPQEEGPSATWEFPSVIGRDGKMMDFDTFKKNPVAASHNAARRVIDEFRLRSLPRTFATP